MADIELVIKIPEWKYKSICEGIEASKRCGVVGIDHDIHEAIYNGTPLPKGHGKLKDADKIANEVNALKDNWNRYGNEYESGRYESYDYAVDTIDNADTIIEADKDSEEIKTISSTSKDEQTALNDTLDEIKAEIIELRSKQNVGVLECLDIIDKHKTDSLDVHSRKKNNDLER